jgi:hypothetical protein
MIVFRRSFLIFILFNLILGVSGCSPIRLPGSDRPTLPGPASSAEGGLVVLKVTIRQAGIYAIDAQELKKTGLDLSASDSKPIRLFWRGLSLPVWIDRAAGLLHFYARASQSIYSAENVYWLVQGDENRDPSSAFWRIQATHPEEIEAIPALALVNLDALPAELAAVSTRLEENIQYYPQVESGDHWLWVSLPAPETHEFEIPLENAEQAPGAIRIAVWARTEGPGETDHHLKLSINGIQVADHSWDGKGRHEIVALVPAGIWQRNTNTIQLEAPGDTGNAADVVIIDWIDIVTAEKFLPQEDRLFFLSSGKAQPLMGFNPPIQGYDITNPLKPVKLDPAMVAGSTFTGQAGHAYWLIGADGGLLPDEIARVDISSNLRALDPGAEYIAIGPPDLLASLQPLLDFRSQTGLSVLAVPLQSVYDQFNGGLPEPEAIRSFLRYASQSWQLRPRYLLLVGDGSYDPQGFQAAPEANRLPVFLVNTVYGGETGSDVVFSQLDEDRSPDLAVGRIPAQTPEQVSAFVEKTLGYERQPAESEWKQRVLAVADGQEDTFRFDAQRFLDLFPDSAQVELMAPAAGETTVNREIVERLNQGDGLVAYFGHGSINMWGKDRLFSTQDVPSLQNTDRYAILINMTCLTGLFTHPTETSLAEAMLLQPLAGAVAVLAPTSLTLPSDQSFLSQPLIEALLDQPDLTLGEALLEARRHISLDNTGSLDVMETFLLFGDPALQLPDFSTSD